MQNEHGKDMVAAGLKMLREAHPEAKAQLNLIAREARKLAVLLSNEIELD